MTTRINYTGRRRINRNRVSLRVSESEGAVLLDGSVSLTGLGLPDSAGVVVEAYRQTSYERVACGTVGDPKAPAGARLSRFPVTQGILFRVKVVGAEGPDHGRLLAVADRIRPEPGPDEGGPSPLLPFSPSRDLGQELWRLDLSDDLPRVLINSGVGDWKGFARDSRFQALVFPEVTRQIARWLVRNLDAVRDEDHPGSGWLKFFTSALGVDPPPAPDENGEAEDWADDASATFARRHDFLEGWIRLEEDTAE